MTPDAISRIKESLPLPMIAVEYAQLRKSGTEWLMVCLWHKDSQPSCRIYEDHYYCFTCQSHGDVIDLVARAEGISKGQAIKQLADRAGVTLDGHRPSRLERTITKQDSEFAAWWKKTTIRRLETQLTAYVRFEHPGAEILGRTLKQVRDATGTVLRGLVQRCATEKDREEWGSWKQECEQVTWMVVAGMAAAAQSLT